MWHPPLSFVESPNWKRMLNPALRLLVVTQASILKSVLKELDVAKRMLGGKVAYDKLSGKVRRPTFKKN